ncbi:hypothetical protein DL764_001088 [Monosporascus ibericus]|uniref:Uncharacterized protein n=1 Tax=Monosporascus ibericus TaxID=155417 RepID=A0A4Q4TVZ6_9PEZI|nr:hypothetical protein DL764_001088 [Monosporascus ibericus]
MYSWQALERLAKLENKRYHLALLSSSALRRVQVPLDKAGQAGFFAKGDVFSAVGSLPVPASKPDPAAYLHALEKPGKMAGECLIIEDSRSGAASAGRAGTRTLGHVGAYEGAEGLVRMSKVLTEAGGKLIMSD